MISKAQVITLQKKFQYCTYCKRDYHTKNKCHNKNLHVKEVSQAISSKISNKQKKSGQSVKKNSTISNSDRGSYFM